MLSKSMCLFEPERQRMQLQHDPVVYSRYRESQSADESIIDTQSAKSEQNPSINQVDGKPPVCYIAETLRTAE
jgi:hypothetical protein